MTTMTARHPTRRVALALCAALSAALVSIGTTSTAHASSDLPGNSLHHLQVELLDQNGETVPLSTYRGRTFIVTMIYASCPSACPMLISDIKRIEKSLSEAVRKDVSVLVVSFDPEKDTPKELAELAKRHKVDPKRWKLASASAEQAAELAAVLGVKYRRTGGGHWIHSSIISVVDDEGVVRGQWEGYLETVNEPAAEVTKVVRASRKDG